MDKYGDKAVDKVTSKSSSQYVSPYLQRPLRSFADVEADRKVAALRLAALRPAGVAVEDSPKAKLPAQQQY